MLNLLETYPKYIGLGEAALDAVIGFLVVFAGISILILIVWLIGFIISRAAIKKDKKVQEIKPIEQPAIEETNDEELVAVITAAISVIYAKENRKAEFVVRKIKKI